MTVGSQIGPYRIERTLGEGGMGVVYVGVHVDLERRAAIKQLLPGLSRQPDVVKRFFSEAKATASIDHPGIVPIYEVGWHTDGSAYFAMKLLEGDTLAKRLRAGPMQLAMACTVAEQIASALNAAHTAGIVHRDLKPANIILVRDDAVKPLRERAIVLDFGIAKLTGDWLVPQKTRTGSSFGTAPYMSPEQHQSSGDVDHRTDVYALGCTLFEMLTGRPPFMGANDYEVIRKLVLEELPTLRSLCPDVPPELEALVMRCLARQPDQRYQTMTELIAELESCPLPTDSANGAVLPEIGASPVAPPMSGPPTPLQRPRKLPEGEPPGPPTSLQRPRKLPEGEPPERELADRELSEREPPKREPPKREPPKREPPKREPPEQEFSGSEPPESEPLERQPIGSRGEVVVPYPRARKRGRFGGIVGALIAAVVAVVFAELVRPVPPPPGDAAGLLDAALVVDAQPVTTVTDSAAHIVIMQDADSSATNQKTDEQQGSSKGIPNQRPDKTEPKQPAEQGEPGHGQGKDRGSPTPQPPPNSDRPTGPPGASTSPPQGSGGGSSSGSGSGSGVSTLPESLDETRNSADLKKVAADVNNICGGKSHARVSVSIEITVGPDGQVDKVTPTNKNLEIVIDGDPDNGLDNDLRSCLEEVPHRTRFPQTQRGGMFHLDFEFVAL